MTTDLVPIAGLPVVTGIAGPDVPPDQHPAAVYIGRLGEGSRRTMKLCVDIVADTIAPGTNGWSFPWGAVRYQHVAALRAALAANYAPATANKVLAACRGVLREAWRLGWLSAEDFHRAIDVPRVPGSRLPAGRGLTGGELSALFGACADGTPAGARDAAMLALLYAGGLRRAEAVAVTLADYSPDDGALKVTCGKGNKGRQVWLGPGAMAAVDGWMVVRGDWDGPLVCPVNKAGKVLQRAMSDGALYLRLRTIAARAGVTLFSPHDLRRSYVSDLLDSGADLSVVQQLAGHASPTTTARYDRRPEVAKRQAAGRLHVPYR